MGCYLELANIDLTQCCMKQVKRAPEKLPGLITEYSVRN